jgi:hypothetical protein
MEQIRGISCVVRKRPFPSSESKNVSSGEFNRIDFIVPHSRNTCSISSMRPQFLLAVST